MRTPFPPVYAIVDGECLAQRGLGLTVATEALLDGGVRLLQLRWKGSWTRDVLVEGRRIAALCREAGAQFVVNDRADIALLLDAGIHVGQDDLAMEGVRRVVGAAAFAGVSTHHEGQFRQALNAAADYVALGPIYGTISKDRPDPVVGIQELARLRALTAKPLVAIGGITRDRAPEVWRAGADSVAIISDLYPEPATPVSVRQRAEEWMRLAHEQRQ